MGKKPILADLHTHLNEKKIEPKEWWSAVKKKKLSAIAITEHAYYKPEEAFLKLKAAQPKGIILIPGVETKTNAGDLLVYGTDENIYKVKEIMEKGIEVEKALKAVKKNNLTASFAHPYGFKLDSICETITEKKAIKLIKKYGIGTEYYNGMLASANQLLFGRKWSKRFFNLLEFMDKNKATTKLRLNWPTHKAKTKLEKIAKKTFERVKKGMLFSKNSKFITAGSDAHYPRAIGSAIIEFKRKPKNEKDFLKMLENKEYIYAGPNKYSNRPIDKIGRKEIWEGLKYFTKKKIFKKPKTGITGKIKGKISLRKRIKTIKRITKKAKWVK